MSCLRGCPWGAAPVIAEERGRTMSASQELRIILNRTALEGAYAVLSTWGIAPFAVEDSALVDEAKRRGWGDYFPEQKASAQAAILCYFSDNRLDQAEQEALRRELKNLRDYGFDPGPVIIVEGQVREEDWAQAWKQYYRPVRIGQGLCQPAWEPLDREPGPGQVVVYLDPGMAFGTGTHPSTAMGIVFLQHVCLEGRTVCDFGSGSGILDSFGAILGAQVDAVYSDLLAFRAAREIRVLNKLEFPIDQGSLEYLQGQPLVREPGPGQVGVYLDPGMAFGTGTHPSTAMCIEYLQHLSHEGRTVCDIGTGSGILALIAA